ncbi:MAG TPA: arginase [Gammaproteobacteria bacterium]|nr:arginase [Gammaproteobacteria bacterium]
MSPAAPQRISLIGAPTDVGAGRRGASMGPEALRVAGIRQSLERLRLEVVDRGNISGPINPEGPRVAGYRHLSEVEVWCRAARDAVLGALRDGDIPILMGGDHSLTIGSVAAVAHYCAERDVSATLLWLDAHADFNVAESSPTGNLHGMPVSILTGLGPPSLTGLGPSIPIIPADRIVQVGVRSVDEIEKQLVVERGLIVWDMRRIDELTMRVVVERALEYLSRRGGHLHVTFDVDFLDPAIAPGVPTTVPGGPTYREAQLCMEMIHDSGLLRSLDVMELNPAFDDRNRTAELAVELVESLFGLQILARAGGGGERYRL